MVMVTCHMANMNIFTSSQEFSLSFFYCLFERPHVLCYSQLSTCLKRCWFWMGMIGPLLKWLWSTHTSTVYGTLKTFLSLRRMMTLMITQQCPWTSGRVRGKIRILNDARRKKHSEFNTLNICRVQSLQDLCDVMYDRHLCSVFNTSCCSMLLYVFVLLLIFLKESMRWEHVLFPETKLSLLFSQGYVSKR